jgi:myo-inositol 2-dehydrogenase / D-chiro-inositol 1-dehydrogenase
VEQLRVGIIGCGRMGAERAAAAKKLGAQIGWFYDSDRERAQQLADKFSGTATPRSEDLDWHSLDAVFVCVPPSYRGPFELQCVANSVPLFVEKPIGLSAKHIVPLLEQAKRAGLVNAVGYMNRYRNSVRLAREVLIGRKVLGISCVWVGKKYRVPWWIDANVSGGPFNEQATHVLDLCRFLVGEIESLSAIAAPSTTAGDPEFGVAVAMRFVRGPLGTVFYSCEAREKDIHLHIFCEEGSLDLEGWDFAMTRNTIDGKLPDREQDDIFVKETRCFLDAVRCRDQLLIECDLEEAFQTQLVVDRVRDSFQSNCSLVRPKVTG